MNISCSSWLKPIFNHSLRNKTIQAILDELTLDRWPQDIHFIAGCGISGMMGLFIAEELKIPFVTIRKKTDKCHGTSLEGIGESTKNKNYLIIDDCIDTGDTLNHIGNQLRNHNCIGLIIYNQDLIYTYDETFVKQPFINSWTRLGFIPQLYHFKLDKK